MENIVKKLYGEENAFSMEKFLAPPIEYAPFYNWIWNAPVSHEETDKQLDEMVRLGIKALAIVPEPKSFRPASMQTFLEPDYLTKPYFEEYQYMVEGIKKRGMLFCLYDEGGWPSGRACGQVMLKHPEFAECFVNSRKVSVTKGDTYAMPTEVLSAFDGEWNQIKDGDTIKADGEITEYFPLSNPFSTPGYPSSPDLTKREATEAFIRMTHEGYKPYLQDYFGNVIRTVFSDEAASDEKIYRKELIEQFEEENGYSVLPYLPDIIEDRPVTEEGAKARIAWFDMLNRVLCENFLVPQKEWCNKHDLAFIGHFNMDHVADKSVTISGNFNLMQSLRNLDIPGVDVIWRQIFPGGRKLEHPCEKPEDINTIFPRYASSAAAQIGCRYSMTESFGVYGGGTDFNQMRYVMNYQAVRGLNMYNIFGLSYGREGFLMGGEYPLFTEKGACYKDLPVMNRYMERLSYLSALGERICHVALYMAVCDFAAGMDKDAGQRFEELGEKMEDARILFDIADDKVFGCVEDGMVRMGKAAYSTIVVPPCRFMPESTKEQLNQLIAQGGKVFVSEEISGLEGAILLSDVKEIADSVLSLSGGAEMVRLCVRQADNGRLLMLFNESDEEKSFSVTLAEKTYLIDVENGKVIEPNMNGTELPLTLPCGKMAFLWQGEDLPCEQETVYNEEEELCDFTFRRTESTTFGYMQFETNIYQEEAKAISLGDWSEVVGIRYSGSGIYSTTFSAPKKEGKVMLDLGEVHASCEVFVNGTSMGVLGMAPFRYEIPAEMLTEENILEIRISNTIGNEHLYTDTFDKWQSWQKGPYYNRCNIFHKDSLQGGLYGPVKIKF